MYDSLREILERIQLGEDSTTEFKSELPHSNSLADEISAFANGGGGIILVGVNDKDGIVGVGQNLDKYEKKVVEVCSSSIKPAVDVITKKIQIDGKPILKIDIPRSLYVHKSPGGYIHRQGSSKREMSTEQVVCLSQSWSHTRIVSFDKQAVPNTLRDTLIKELYLRFVGKETTDHEVEDLLLKRHILTRDGESVRASVAGILMCHDEPDRHVRSSYIQAVYYRSNEKDANYQVDAKDFKGPLDEQIMSTFKFVEKYNQIAAHKSIGRTDYPQYSLRAIFEAIVNAVIHRDYSIYQAKIRLFMFTDRLEMYSPGALANTMTVSSLPYDQATRNELLARLLSETVIDDDMGGLLGRRKFLELRGEGVGIILRESKQISGKKPVYELIGEESLRLTIPAASPPPV